MNLTRPSALAAACALCVLLSAAATSLFAAPSPSLAASLAGSPQILPIVTTPSGWRSLIQRYVVVPKGVTHLVMERKQGTEWITLKVQPLTFAATEKSKLVLVAPPAGIPVSQIRMAGFRNSKFPATFAKGQSDFERLEKPWPNYQYIGFPEGPIMYLNPIKFSTGVIILPDWNLGFTPQNGLSLTLTPTNTDDANTVMSGTYLGASGGIAANATSNATSNATANSTPTSSEASLTPAQEADIWKICGRQLFFFNQYRGLQVFDMTHPEAPLHTGTLRMAASGEEMFVLNEEGSLIALLGKSTELSSRGTPAVLFVKIAGGIPTLLKQVNLPEPVIDSRVMGNKLYLLSQPLFDAASLTATGRATLRTLDFANPAAPAFLPDLPLIAGGSTCLQAAGHHLLVSTNTFTYFYKSDLASSFSPIYQGLYLPTGLLHLIDTNGAAGAPVLIKTFKTKGPVLDKFKVGIVNGAVVAVTQFIYNDISTWVETFPLEGTSTEPLAQTALPASNVDRLFATRFDGDRLYVVTFHVIDPLFVVDLSNPAAPITRGMAEVPGYSTYIEPHGNRLLAVGLESNHVTASLFDVTDVTAPVLLKRLLLGPAGGSWSEVTYNEKAFEYFPEDGLLMVPVQTSDGIHACVNAMQAIEVGADTIAAGITIPMEGTARRGGVIGEHIISISGQQMLVHRRNAALNDPAETELSLSWKVERIIAFGGYLLQISDGSDPKLDTTHTPQKTTLRVSPIHDPDALVEEMEMGTAPIIATAQSSSRAFLAQYLPAAGDVPPVLRTWILDLSAPPLVKQVTTLDRPLTAAGRMDLAAAQGLWPTADTLVWYLPVTDTPLAYPLVKDPKTAKIVPYAFLCPVMQANGAATAGALISQGSAKDVRSTSRAFAASGLLYASCDEGTAIVTAPSNGILGPLTSQSFKARSWLRVVDFTSNPPLQRVPVSIPGELLSITQADARSAVLITTCAKDDGSTRQVQSSAYDGVSAYLMGSRLLDQPMWNTVTADGGHLYFASSPRAGDGRLKVTAWGYDESTGAINDLGILPLDYVPATLHVAGNYLLAGDYGHLSVARIAPTGELNLAADFDTPYELQMKAERPVFAPAGIFVPAGAYGAEFLPYSQMTP